MAAGKIYKYNPKKHKRRARKRRGTNVNKTTVVSLTRNLLPLSYITRHRYSGSFSMDASLGVAAVYAFKANGIFDPDDAVGGHSAILYDTLKTLWDHSTVLGSKITVNFVSSANDVGSGATMCGIFLNDDASPITTYDTVIEQGNGVYGCLTPSDAKSHLRLTKKFSAKQYFGCKDVMDREDLKGTTNSDPTELCHFVLFNQAMVSSSNPAAVYGNAVIEYIVKWTEPKDISQSG